MDKTGFFFCLVFFKLLEGSSFLADDIWGMCVLRLLIGIAQLGMHTVRHAGACHMAPYVESTEAPRVVSDSFKCSGLLVVMDLAAPQYNQKQSRKHPCHFHHIYCSCESSLKWYTYFTHTPHTNVKTYLKYSGMICPLFRIFRLSFPSAPIQNILKNRLIKPPLMFILHLHHFTGLFVFPHPLRWHRRRSRVGRSWVPAGWCLPQHQA